jgi:DNA-binding SARP family transcriptional activator
VDDAWRLRRARTLVKLLALAPRHRHQREQAVDALWGEHTPSDRWNSPHQVVRAARRAFEFAAPAKRRTQMMRLHAVCGSLGEGERQGVEPLGDVVYVVANT